MSSLSIHGVPLDQITLCLEGSDQYFNHSRVPPPLKKLVVGGGGSTCMPRFYCAKADDDLYIVIRGATEAHDFMTVLNMAHEPLAGGEVHGGVLACSRWIIAQCRAHIDACKGNIIVTGHSLGGACSAVIAMILRLEEKRGNVTAITAGAFPVFTDDLKKISEEFVTALVYNNDVVPNFTQKAIVSLVGTLGAAAPNVPPEQARDAANVVIYQMLEGVLRSRGVTDAAVFAALKEAIPKATKLLSELPKGAKDLFCAGDVTRVAIGPDGSPSLQRFVPAKSLNMLMIPAQVMDHNLQLLLAALRKLARPAPAAAKGPQEVEDLD